MSTNDEDLVEGRWSKLINLSGVGVVSVERADIGNLIDHVASIKADRWSS